MSAAHKYIDLEFDAAVVADQAPVEISINGVTGTIEWGRIGSTARGKWASHTGYRSLHGQYGDPYAIAAELYEANAKLPFLVGEEHRENGWRSISINYRGEIEIRLPTWHAGIVAACLERYGMTPTCKLNNFWIFPESMGVSIELTTQLLAPLLKPHTRFSDESELAKLIDNRARELGYLPGTPLSEGAMQTSLF